MANQTKYEGWTVDYRMTSGQTLTALRFVKLGADATISAVAAVTDLAIGVLLEKTARTDVSVPVLVSGICDVEVGTAGVTRGYLVKIDDAGCVVNATPANAEIIVGRALETGTDGNYVKVVVAPSGMPAS